MKLIILFTLLTLSGFAQEPVVTSMRWYLNIPGIANTGHDKYMVMVAPQRKGVVAVTVNVQVEGEKVQSQTLQTSEGGVVFVFTVSQKPSLKITRQVFEILAGSPVEEVK